MHVHADGLLIDETFHCLVRGKIVLLVGGWFDVYRLLLRILATSLLSYVRVRTIQHQIVLREVAQRILRPSSCAPQRVGAVECLLFRKDKETVRIYSVVGGGVEEAGCMLYLKS